MFRSLLETPRGSLLPKWILIWLVVSTALCILDVFFTTMRPLTTRGGALSFFYEPWNIYADVDYRYADEKDLVTMATGRVMMVEIVMNFVVFYMNHKGSRHTLLTTFTTSAFAFWKTVWYLVLYIRQPEGTPPYLNPDSSFLRTFFVFWVADGVWVVLPLLVMVALWNRLARDEYVECTSIKDEDLSEA